MPSIVVLNQKGLEVGKVEVSEKVFGITPNMQVVYDVINAQRASMRQGTHKTKGRSEVSGGGRKPWRQKGTGRARQGTTRAPQWRGGGIVFGPTPRSYKVKVNKKVTQLAVKSLLSDKCANSNIVVVDKFELETFKTKEFVGILEALKASGKIVVITEESNYNLFTASNNIPNVYAQTKNHLSVYDLINADMYIMTEAVIKQYEEELK